MNLINVNIDKPSCRAPHNKFATWNAHSLNTKSAHICDLVISQHLDILAITETWLSDENFQNNNTVTEILNTLKDFEFHHVPRVGRIVGGIGVFLRKGFNVSKSEMPLFSSVECMDSKISHGSSSVRLITIYRPPPSKKNKATATTFFEEFSILLETVNLTSGYLLLNGDFNFHMESSNDAFASAFSDLLDSAGLRQHVTGPTHRSGHTFDLIIDRQDDNVLSSFSVLSDLPSDHKAVLCSVAFSRPKATKSHFTVRRLLDIDMTAFKLDLLNLPLSPDSQGFSNDPNELVDVYNSVLQETLDKHAPGESRSITLRPHAPWFTDGLRELKREKRRCERAYRKFGLVVHEQIYRDKCRRYNMMLNQAKTQYYQTKIELKR